MSFYLSQSALKDWKSMCPIQWREKWKKYENEEDNPWYIGDRPVIRLGNWYEQQVIGISRGGKTTELTTTERKSAKGRYAASQAKLTKEWLRSLPGKIRGVQQELKAEFWHNGTLVKIIGNLDIDFAYDNGTPLVIDLKLTGDRDTTFGYFKWGDIENMDITQMKQYKLLSWLNYGIEPETKYHVIDVSTKMKVGLFNIIISDQTMEEYKDLLAEVYKEIAESFMLNVFEPKNTYDNCSICPIASQCKFRNEKPDEQDIYF